MAPEIRDDAGLQVVFDGSGAGLEPASQHPGHGLRPISNRTDNIPELAAQPDAASGHNQYTNPDADNSCPYAEKTVPAARGWLTLGPRWMIRAVVVLLIVVIAVLGGFLGSLSHSAPAASAVPTAFSPNASSINNDTGMAAVAWLEMGTEVRQYRVYYQSASNEIRERAWNNSQNCWYTLNDVIGLAKNGSPLVAATNMGAVVSSVQATIYYKSIHTK